MYVNTKQLIPVCLHTGVSSPDVTSDYHFLPEGSKKPLMADFRNFQYTIQTYRNLFLKNQGIIARNFHQNQCVSRFCVFLYVMAHVNPNNKSFTRIFEKVRMREF